MPGDGYQFATDPSAFCEGEDVPPEHLPLIGRRRWLVGLYIESAPFPDALAAFEMWLTDVLADTKGILIDEQAECGQSAAKTVPSP